jgi:hypothetical protein
MKYPVVCGTIHAARKGKEVLAPTTHKHPLREEAIISPKDSMKLPVKVLPKKIEKSEDEKILEKIKAEVAKMASVKPKPAKIPASRILGLVKPKEEEPVPEPMNYNDILKMLAAVKK